MPRFKGEVGVGDVLVTREGPWFVSAAIRLGARLAHLPTYVNHAIIVHHTDAYGTVWGLEGRPGGVGWRDLTDVLTWSMTNANNEQPKDMRQRYLLAIAAESMLRTPYDWKTIEEHTRAALLERLWRRSDRIEWVEGERPGHVVCSSYADWCYEKVGLANPGGEKLTRLTTPGHWDKFIMEKEWL